MKKIRLPRLKNTIYEMIRVNYAGEYGAKQIYLGQLSVLKSSKYGPEIKHMLHQEEEHLEYFNEELLKRKIRPSLLQPFWHHAGYALGRITALCGINMAMSCTEAVEEVIDKHYLKQLDILNEIEPKLSAKIIKFRKDELEHKKIASGYNKDNSLVSKAVTTVIKLFCKISINLAKKI